MEGDRQKWEESLRIAFDGSRGWQEPGVVQSLNVNAGFVLGRHYGAQLLPLTKGIQLIIRKLTVTNEGSQPGISF